MSLSSSDFFPELLEGFRALLGAHAVAVFRFHAEAGGLRAEATVGLPDGWIEAAGVVPVGEGSCGTAVERRSPVVVEDVFSDPRFATEVKAARLGGYRAALSVPFAATNGEGDGTVTSYFSERHRPTAREIEGAAALARRAADLLELARLRQENHRIAALGRLHAQQLHALAEASVALGERLLISEILEEVNTQACRIAGIEQAITCLLDERGWDAARVAVSVSDRYPGWQDYKDCPGRDGLGAVVVDTNRPLRLTQPEVLAHPRYPMDEDARGLRPPLRGYLGVPLIARDGRNMGLIQLSHKTQGEFTAEDEAIAVQLGQIASVVIDYALLVERERAARAEAEDRARRRALLAEASRKFAETLNPEQIIDRILGFSVPALADWACVHQADDRGVITLAGVRAASQAEERMLASALGGLVHRHTDEYGVGRVIGTRRSVRYPEITDETLARVAAELGGDLAALRLLRMRSGIVVPLLAHDQVIGALTLARTEGGKLPPYGEDDVDLFEGLAASAAVALDTATRYAFERRAAATLQRALLPQALPITTTVSHACRYVAGAAGLAIGGDWYDLIELSEGRLGLVVGDVMGRGIQAASMMGQLRSAVRAYALELDEPMDVLGRLDRLVTALDETQLTTCVYGVLDPVSGRLSMAVAGHLPPLLIAIGQPPMFLDLDPGLPLGVGGAAYSQSEVTLRGGETVLLYTDGLVERQDLSLDEGLARLREAASAPVADLEELCDRVLAAFHRTEGPADDTALLAVALTPPAAAAALGLEGPSTLDLERDPRSAAAARAFVAAALKAAGLEHHAERAGLLASELVTNALRYSQDELRLELAIREDVLRVDVSDGTSMEPAPRQADPLRDEHGRGLMLVDALADRWGSERLAYGKRVWFELDL